MSPGTTAVALSNAAGRPAKGLFSTLQTVGRHMVDRTSGGIVAISSHASLVGIRDHAVYGASKGAVNQLVRVLAVDGGWTAQ